MYCTETIDILNVDYRVFFRVLRAKFVAEYYANDPKIKVIQIWDELDPATNKSNSLRFFVGTGITDSRYFYRKYHDLKPTKGIAVGPINVRALINGLEYIGFKVIDFVPFDKQKKELKVLANHLLQAFTDQYAEEIKAEKKLAGSKFVEEQDDEESNIYIAEQQHVSHYDTDSSFPDDLSNAVSVVYAFYDYINNESYKEAWKILSPVKQHKKPWEGDFEKFKAGYINTSQLQHVAVLPASQKNSKTVECKVFYDDEINVYTSAELHQFEILTVGNIDSFVLLVKSLQENFKNKGLSGFENIELKKLFDPDASEYIWHKANFPSKELDKIFPIRKTITIRRVQECTCIYVQGNWLINEIKSVKSYPIQ